MDEAVVRRLITLAGGQPGAVYGKNGKGHLRQKIGAYNRAARHAPWVVLVDLDHEADCPPSLLAGWVRDAAGHLCFRVAVRAVEAWLMADAEALARFLSIPRSRVPRDPEGLDDPKQVMVDLARGSQRAHIRADMVPRESGGRAVGPAYSSRLIEYAQEHWRPEVAAQRAASLRRAMGCLKRLIGSVE
ncbi:MAG TPA: hypothetical protein VF192_10020 [Longimicrobiales bacterium]